MELSAPGVIYIDVHGSFWIWQGWLHEGCITFFSYITLKFSKTHSKPDIFKLFLTVTFLNLTFILLAYHSLLKDLDFWLCNGLSVFPFSTTQVLGIHHLPNFNSFNRPSKPFIKFHQVYKNNFFPMYIQYIQYIIIQFNNPFSYTISLFFLFNFFFFLIS